MDHYKRCIFALKTITCPQNGFARAEKELKRGGDGKLASPAGTREQKRSACG